MRYKVTNASNVIQRVERVSVGPGRSTFFEALPKLPDGNFRVQVVADEVPDDVAEAEAIEVRKQSRRRGR